VGAHAAVAVEFGTSKEVIDSLMAGLDSADINEKMRPVFEFIRKLTLTPAEMAQEDADRVFDAGWDERALHDAIEVCALFNFMNRYVEGHGLIPMPDKYQMEGKLLRGGYIPLLKVLGLDGPG
jgi:alkylhydroperoxidase family enzyme